MSDQQRRQTNRDRVLAYLQAHGRARNYELVQIGGMRAMGRVHELRQAHALEVRPVEGGVWEVIYHGPRTVGQQALF